MGVTLVGCGWLTGCRGAGAGAGFGLGFGAGAGAGAGSGAGSGAGTVVGTGSSAASAELTPPATAIPQANPSAQRGMQTHIASMRVEAPIAPSRRRTMDNELIPFTQKNDPEATL